MLNLNSELSTNMSDVWKVPRSRQRWCKDLTTIIFIVSNFVSELIIMYLDGEEPFKVIHLNNWGCITQKPLPARSSWNLNKIRTEWSRGKQKALMIQCWLSLHQLEIKYFLSVARWPQILSEEGWDGNHLASPPARGEQYQPRHDGEIAGRL